MTGSGHETPWSLKGVSPEVRKLAKRAATEAGLPIGTWLSAAIKEVGEAERREREAEPAQREPPPDAGTSVGISASAAPLPAPGELRQALGSIAPGQQQAGGPDSGPAVQDQPNPVRRMQDTVAAAEINAPARKRSNDAR